MTPTNTRPSRRRQSPNSPHPEARIWDRFADSYAAKPVPDEAVYAEKLAITRTHLTPESTVVEFGCGTGSTALAHAPHVNHIIASDVSPRMIEIARGKARDAGVDNVHFCAVPIEELEIADGTADVVLGLSILHLLKDRRAAIAKAYAMTRPGGVFISSTACRVGWMRLLQPLLSAGRWLGLVPRVSLAPPQQLRDELTAEGFVIERDWRPGAGSTAFIVARKPS